MRYLQNGRRGEGGEEGEEEEELWQVGEEGESYSGSHSACGGESGYSSTRTESSSPHHSTREEGGPASLPSQVKTLETRNTSQFKMLETRMQHKSHLCTTRTEHNRVSPCKSYYPLQMPRMANGDERYAWNGGKLSEATKTKLPPISQRPLCPKMKAVTVCSSSSSATEYLRRHIL